MYLSLYCKGLKRLFKVCVWEGVGDRTETAIFWPPFLWPSTLCLSRSPGLLNRRPRGPLCWVICYILSATSLDPNSIRAPRPLRPDVALPTTSRPSPTPTLTGTPWLLSWLSYIIVQRPLSRLLDFWNVGSSSSGNNSHAVHRSLSSGASVYECTMEIFYLIRFHQPISAHGISSHNCHWNVSLPSGASLWMAFLAGSKVKIPQ